MNETTPSPTRLSSPPNVDEDGDGGRCTTGKDVSRGRISPSSSEEELGSSLSPDDDGSEAGSEMGRRPSAGQKGGNEATSVTAVGDGISPGPRMDDVIGRVEAAQPTPSDDSLPASVAGGEIGQPPEPQDEEKRRADSVPTVVVAGEEDRLASFLAASDGFRLGGVATKLNVQSSDDGEDGTEGEETSPFMHGADVAASALAKGAEMFRRGLEVSVVPRVSSALDAAGGLAKEGMGPVSPAATAAAAADILEPAIDEVPGGGRRRRQQPDRDVVVARVYSDAARRATGGVLRASKFVALGACDAATGAIQAAKRKVAEDDEGRIGKVMIPDRQDREILAASGRVALAGLGAAAVVAESLYDATRAIARKGASVTADVVQHKYGEDTRDIVEDTSEALGNTIEAVTFVHMMEAAALTKAIANNTGKESIKHDMVGDA